ncbi:MAG TPA: flippase activity-associated protein Agl23 [Sedimentisphaerales bacterium]|nr:flippase activity-associated protein Agl23 [Sedimentisphaerales bacterium]
MKCPRTCCVLILAAAAAAVWLRLPRLDQRPMHGDEAVHAVKFGELLEKGYYRYDPNEYHGPTLNYFTLIPARLSGMHKFKDLDEFALRIVPVFFGVLLVLLLLLLADGLGTPAASVAAILTAVSPAFVFYSRYYIQETLLVCFSFGAIASGYRYARSKDIRWALLTGIFLGLAHATKETFIISFGSMLLALVLTLVIQGRQASSAFSINEIIKPRHVIAMAAAAVMVSALFYSSFLTNPAGVWDSVRSYIAYINRTPQNNPHLHPWYYYLKMLMYSRYGSGPVWSESMIVILALVGFVVAMTRKKVASFDANLLTFIALYTLIMTAVYSVFPYKTPWCLLGFLQGMILLAGVGAVAVVKLLPKVLPRLIVLCLLVEGTVHLTWQAYLANYRFYADARNPYVYAHPVTDVISIAQRVEQVARVHPDGLAMRVDVICPGGDYWPLPWYLRRFEERSIGWYDKVDDRVPAAPVIIASDGAEPALMKKLYELPPPGQRHLYVPLFDSYMQLRPQVELRGYVTKDLWDAYRRQKAQSQQNQGTKK